MLRQAREAKGLTIEQLSTITRLNPQFIEALEEGRWDRLPGQVYLKPFAKTCAEALEIDVKEVYKLIDGERMERTDMMPAATDLPPVKKGFDYKLPLVIIAGLAVIGLIFVTVVYQQRMESGPKEMKVVPADAQTHKLSASKSRPWEKPAEWRAQKPYIHRLRLEATDQVWAAVFSQNDTLFAGFINAGQGKTLYSNSGFTISLGRNDCVSGYLDGSKISEIGTSARGLYNFHPSIEQKETSK